jgi:hypothetical protein
MRVKRNSTNYWAGLRRKGGLATVFAGNVVR